MTARKTETAWSILPGGVLPSSTHEEIRSKLSQRVKLFSNQNGSCATVHNMSEETKRESTDSWPRHQFHTSTCFLSQRTRQCVITIRTRDIRVWSESQTNPTRQIQISDPVVEASKPVSYCLVPTQHTQDRLPECFLFNDPAASCTTCRFSYWNSSKAAFFRHNGSPSWITAMDKPTLSEIAGNRFLFHDPHETVQLKWRAEEPPTLSFGSFFVGKPRGARCTVRVCWRRSTCLLNTSWESRKRRGSSQRRPSSTCFIWSRADSARSSIFDPYITFPVWVLHTPVLPFFTQGTHISRPRCLPKRHLQHLVHWEHFEGPLKLGKRPLEPNARAARWRKMRQITGKPWPHKSWRSCQDWRPLHAHELSSVPPVGMFLSSASELS